MSVNVNILDDKKIHIFPNSTIKYIENFAVYILSSFTYIKQIFLH